MLVASLALVIGRVDPARAQGDPSDLAEVVDEGPGRGIDPARVPPADEFPEGVGFGPPQSERQRASPPQDDATEPALPHVVQIHVGLGVALGSSLDEALVAHRYGDSRVVVAGDITFAGRMTEWLHLGARVGARGRGWASAETEPALAGGVDALALGHARGQLGRVVDIGLQLGIGIGWAGLSVQHGSASGFAPRLHGSGIVGFRFAPGARLMVRFAWDWFSVYDLDRYGSDLDLGGPSAAVGLEVRV